MLRWLSTAMFTLLFFVWLGARIGYDIQFYRNVEDYLKRAADANTIDLASENLEVALKYLEANNLTTGYTSILWRTPDEDIEFWYTNLKTSLEELRRVRPEATQLERANVLMKLRKTLLDNGHEGRTTVTVPAGISVFPQNALYFLWGWISGLLALVSWDCCFGKREDNGW